MSDKVQIVCKRCEAVLAMPGTADDIVNRKVRCPKCQMKFVARPEMVRTVTATKPADTEKPPAKTLPARKPLRVVEEIVDDVEILDDDDELLEFPAPKSSRSKRPAKPSDDDDDDFDDLPVSPKKKRDSKPKKKVKKAPTRSFGAAVVLWTLGGIVGGFVGGGLWWGIAYATGYNVWYLSVLTGTFVGAGVRLGAAQYEGWMPATTAVLITLAAVFFSKLTLNYTLYFREFQPPVMSEASMASEVAAMSENEMISEYVNEVVAPEYRKLGKPVDNPKMNDEDWEDIDGESLYHPALWADAQGRWRALPPQEQAAFRQQVIDRNLGIDRQSMIYHVVDSEVKPFFAQQNKTVELTEAEQDASPTGETYTAEALQEAEKRLDAKTPEERTQMIAILRGQTVAAEKFVAGIFIIGIFVWTILGMLWPGNLICLVLACISAYQIGNYDGVTT